MMLIQRTKSESLEKEKDLHLDPKAAMILIVVQEAEKGEREATQVQDLAVPHQSKSRSFHIGNPPLLLILTPPLIKTIAYTR